MQRTTHMENALESTMTAQYMLDTLTTVRQHLAITFVSIVMGTSKSGKVT